MNVRSKIAKSFISLILFVSVGIAACTSQRYPDKIRYNWGIDLPSSMTLLYHYRNTGFGDGSYFYVYDVDRNLLTMDFSDVNDAEKERINEVCESLLTGIDADFLLDWEHDCKVYHTEKNDDFLFFIYDDDLSRLTILEVLI